MAQSELIIMIFEHRHDALWARQALELMREPHLFGLEHATEITRDSAGRTMIHLRLELPAYPHARHSRLPSLLSAAIFGQAVEDRLRGSVDLGLDGFFLKSVTEALVPNSSALLIFVPCDGRPVDTRALLNAIALLKGTLHHTSVPQELEKTLLSHVQLF